ncbi:LacI family DNA-binding transcriptional regulator [Clostridium sp. D2Q-14]|uniref:LacI family DNA-binding transcriptional regulator n=1 Tax=Anaeromonas gelatinilytica TaxID=2683194 RepID=UPI00193AF13B|nr:LacI family DNA-binding transcriptional regulator [Anaeromonas gelatinilytica]MBS4536770.1 LacI family DNA-binding transcriptional regulator [Anaeromonas gelatinilytica]
MAVTIKDIARIANVSIATVSKVINGKDSDLSEKTIENVKRIIEEENYSPNSLARSMITKKTKTIGLIIPDVSNPFFTDLTRGAEDIANKRGYSIFYCNTDDDLDKEIRYINNLIEKQVDGIALSGAIVRDKRRERNININVPIVSLDREVYFKGIQGNIEVDNFNGAYEAVNYLIEIGHKSILFLSGQLDIRPSKKRLEGYKKALKDNDIPFDEDLVIVGEFSSDFGYKIMNEMQLKDDTKAIFCGNDLIAIGAMNALKEKGKRIPGDVSIVGFDDIYISSLVNPRLTTVMQPSYDIGYKAVERLIDIIEKKDSANKEVKIQTKLIIRESTSKRA